MEATDLIPIVLRANIPDLYTTEQQHDPTAWVKLVGIEAGIIWYVTELSREDGVTCFGYILDAGGGDGEFGYFNLTALSDPVNPQVQVWEVNEAGGAECLAMEGLIGKVERDTAFEPCSLSHVKP